ANRMVVDVPRPEAVEVTVKTQFMSDTRVAGGVYVPCQCSVFTPPGCVVETVANAPTLQTPPKVSGPAWKVSSASMERVTVVLGLRMTNFFGSHEFGVPGTVPPFWLGTMTRRIVGARVGACGAVALRRPVVVPPLSAPSAFAPCEPAGPQLPAVQRSCTRIWN